MINHEIWQSVLAELELSISKPNFVTWFKNTDIFSYQDSCVVLCVPNEFSRAWMEKKYNQMIVKSLERVTGKPIKKLEYKIFNIKSMSSQPPADESKTQTGEFTTISINPTPSETIVPPRVGEFGLNQI